MSNESFSSQLSKAKKKILNIKTVHNPGMWVKEGEDHININKYSQTKLGQMLSLDYVRHWEHDLLGPFRSLNSLWFFLKAKYKSDEIRTITGYELKDFVRNRCGGQIGRIPHFHAVILDSAYQRLKQYPEAMAEIAKSTIPFDCYRVMSSGVCVRFEHSEWFTRGYEEIRSAIKEKREPDFKQFRDTEKTGTYDAVLEMVSPNHEARAKQARDIQEASNGMKKRPGGQAYDGSKIANIDKAPLKKVAEKPTPAKKTPEAPVVAKEVLPDYKVAVDPGVGSEAAVVAIAEVSEDAVKVVAFVDPVVVAQELAPVEQTPVEAPVAETGEKPLNALQLALQTSGLVAEEPAQVVGEADEWGTVPAV